jgi:glycerol-1-phosphate dehydrogenase [NAD(P)+]
MDLEKILHDLQNCPCGKKHTLVTKIIEISSGVTHRTGELLAGAGFPKKVLLVADDNTLRASAGLLESLSAAGYEMKKLIYPDMKYARVEQVRELLALCPDVDGIISIGSGSLNDLCRVAAFQTQKRFCIFATAPSMDGFASDTAPIIENNFKTSWKAEQPEIIIADTKILAKAPVELKAAGFGDMVAKYLGILEWRISNLIIDEYYCPAVAGITMKGVEKVISLADKVTLEDEESAGGIMEGLVLSGIGMKLAASSRPASGAEHLLSHYWECYKLARGIWSEYHGKKVGVATVLINRIYHNIAERVTDIDPIPDPTDWDKVRAAYAPEQIEDLMKLNNPTVTDEVDPARLKEVWPEIRRLIKETLPSDAELMRLMKGAGAATEPADIAISPELLETGLRYHAYMRHRLMLTRLLPMLQLDVMDFVK